MLLRIIYGAVFLSGFASLGYELCWIRTGALLIGATPQALCIVVAVFFGGMASGAFLFGLASRRTEKPLLWYGILECAIGLMAAATPVLFVAVGKVSVLASAWAGSSHPLQLLVRSLLVASLIVPSCIAMGGTLPLLCQFFINQRRADIRSAAGTLYTINTGGAFCGCMLCGMFFIPYWGIDVSLWFNATISFLTGVVIIFLTQMEPSFPALSPVIGQSSPPPPDATITRYLFYALFFCAGFAALGYEIVWVRFLALIIHNTVYTGMFSLGAVLLGIACGSWLVLRLTVRSGQDVLLFAGANIFISFSVLLILLQPVTTWDVIRNSRSVPLQALLCIGIIFLPSVASGISFPLAYRLVAARAVNSGRDFGFLTAANTLGGIAGSLLVGFYLLPETGLYAAVIILTCISLTIGTYTLFAFADGITLLRRGLLAGGMTLLWGGISLFGEGSLPADFLAGNRPLLEFSEGLSSFIAVVKRDGIVTLEIDRLWQGQNPKGHQILAAHIPMLLHQEPKRVLIIGMGTGQTASRFLMYDIERLDCVDIEKTLPGILQRHFAADWLSDPRTHVITDDGRAFTASTKATYDVVSIEVGQSFRPQVASFYTVDFYRDVKQRLAKNGLACQFVPVGFFTEAEFNSVVSSFLAVFPQSTLWFNKYAELILIGGTTHQPLLDAKRLDVLRNNRKIRSDLDYSFDGKPLLAMNQPEVFAANFLMGAATLSRVSGHAPLYRDDRPILEYQTARTAYAPGRFHGLIEHNMDMPKTIFADMVSAVTEATIIKIRAETVHKTLAGESK